MMHEQLRYDELYTKLTASLVIWENEVSQQEGDPEFSEDQQYKRSLPELILDMMNNM